MLLSFFKCIRISICLFQIGGLNFVLLFDCEEYYMQNRLIKRGKESGRIDDNISAIAKKLHYYKHNTLPIMKYYDDGGKLVVVSIAVNLS